MQRNETGDHGATGRFDIFFTAAVATVVLVRAFLITTGYPKLGGGRLHVAHVLWGGLLMAAAIIIALTHRGSRSQLRAAWLGGVGFGLFIDEVGKFLTKDVNYFFRPALAIIYLVFVVMYLLVRRAALHRPLSDGQRLAIAAAAVTDRALDQLTAAGRRYALAVLHQVRSEPDLVGALSVALTAGGSRGLTVEGQLTRFRDRVHDHVAAAVGHRRFHVGLLVAALLQTAALCGELALLLVAPAAGRSPTSSAAARIAQATVAASAAYTLAAVAALLKRHRARALRMLLRSVLFSLLVTQVFVFAHYQASGAAGLVADLALFGLLRAVSAARPETFHDSEQGVAPRPA